MLAALQLLGEFWLLHPPRVVPHRCPAGHTGAACKQRRANPYNTVMSWGLLLAAGCFAVLVLVPTRACSMHAELCHTVCHVSGVGHPAELGCGGALLPSLPG